MKKLLLARAAVFSLALAITAPAFAADDLTLLDAVKMDDAISVQDLLARKADPNAVLTDSTTVLSWAATHQNPEIVKVLLAAGANPNARDHTGMTPFLFACRGSDVSIVTMMLDAKADVQAKRPDGISALSYCAQYSSPAVLQRMIAGGAKVDAADTNGQTPLMWASAGGRLDNIDLLLKSGAKVNAASVKGFTPLFFAIKSPSAKAPEVLMAAGADINHVSADGTMALMLAGYAKKFDLAALLVQHGANISATDQNGDTPLTVAALNNQVDYAKLLIAKGADVNGVSAPSKLNWQIEPNAGRAPAPRYVGLPPLLIAAQKANIDIMRALIASGAKKDFRASDGTNVVLAAATSGSLATLKYAVELAPDTSVTTDAGVTPMHMVFNNPTIRMNINSPDMAPMILFLADKGFPVQARTYQGKMPLDVSRSPPPEVRKAYEQAQIAHAPRLSDVVAANKGPARR